MSVSSPRKKINIISCSFGEQRSINPPVQQETDLDVVITSYTEDNFPNREKSLSPRLKGKIPKMLGYLYVDADYYIWLDSKFSIKSPYFVDWMVSNVGDSSISLFNHYNRSSIESECIFVESGILNGDNYLIERYQGEDMRGQVDKYLKDNHFTDDKLFACGMFIYRKELIENHPNFMKDWLLENVLFSIQDQLSLPYMLHKHGVKFGVFKEHILNNNYISYV